MKLMSQIKFSVGLIISKKLIINTREEKNS